MNALQSNDICMVTMVAPYLHTVLFLLLFFIITYITRTMWAVNGNKLSDNRDIFFTPHITNCTKCISVEDHFLCPHPLIKKNNVLSPQIAIYV